MPIKSPDHIVCSVDPPPEHFQYAFERTLYHLHSYLNVQPHPPQHSFWLLDQEERKVLGNLHFHVNDKLAVSHSYAPFGSYNGCDPGEKQLSKLVEAATSQLRKQGVERIELNHPSSLYDFGPGWEKSLREQGYQTNKKINHHIEIDEIPFKDKIHVMQQRKLSKSNEFRFNLLPLSDLLEVYKFIAQCRKERAQDLSLTYESLQMIASAHPDRFLICSVSIDGVRAAASVVVKVTSRHWYSFYPAHRKRFNKESPMVFLLDGLYNEAQSQDVQAIDLGTSEVNGKPLEGLLEFKSRVGGVQTIKPTYFKVL